MNRLTRLSRLAELRRTPGLIGADIDRRGRAVLAEIEDWIRNNPDGTDEERRAALDDACRRNDFPTLAVLESSTGGGFDGS